MIYRDFEPVAVLDWEMAAVGPRELDLAWLVFAHRVFETIAGDPGAARHARLPARGRRAGDVRRGSPASRSATWGWYQLYDAVQWGIVFMRTGARQVHFGEIEAPDDVETLIHHRPLFEQLLDEAGA